jgi:hypothetical protein
MEVVRFEGSGSSSSLGSCCVISTVAYHYTVAVSILILLMNDSDLHMRENLRRQTGEDPLSDLEVFYK